MKLIAGLGNPGPDYSKTRHNAGFMALDHIVSALGLSSSAWRKKGEALILPATVRDFEVMFIKPMSYMNLSGHPISAIMSRDGLVPSNLVVIHDEIDIPLGDVRFKTGGGHGGHNGLRSIIAETGSASFHRIRIGVSRPPAGMSASDYVLDGFQRDEKPLLEESLKKAATLFEEKFLIPA